MQARASLQEDIFEDFSCDADVINFTVNLSTLLSCLNLHGQTSEIITASFYYSSEEAIFKLTLEESGILSVCEMNTIDMADDDNPGLFEAFQSSNETSQIILKSSILYESISEILEMPDTKTIQIEIIKYDNHSETTVPSSSSNNQSLVTEGMKFVASGSFSTCEILLPKHCDAAFVSYRCEKACVWSYPSHVVSLGM